MTRILYLMPGLVPPQPDVTLDRYFYLSEVAEGDVLLPIWYSSAERAAKDLGGRFPSSPVGRFTYHLYLNDRLPAALRGFGRLLFYIRKGMALHRARKINVIVTYGTNMPGVAGALLKWLTGAKLIIEIPGNVAKTYLVEPQVPFINRIKNRISRLFVHISVGAADCAKLLYSSQLSSFPRLRHKPVAVFHDFVPVSLLEPRRDGEKTILTVGYPWYVKGTDVLIQAFKKIAARIPAYKLILMGYYPDRHRLEAMIGDCDRVEFRKPTAVYRESLQTISSCGMFALPSRTEAMGRVLLEAMAFAKPIIASAVDGIPTYVAHEDNGLLVPPEDVDALAQQMLRVIENPELAIRLADRAHQRVHSEFDEKAFVRNFQQMLGTVCVADGSCLESCSSPQ